MQWSTREVQRYVCQSMCSYLMVLFLTKQNPTTGIRRECNNTDIITKQRSFFPCQFPVLLAFHRQGSASQIEIVRSVCDIASMTNSNLRIGCNNIRSYFNSVITDQFACRLWVPLFRCRASSRDWLWSVSGITVNRQNGTSFVNCILGCSDVSVWKGFCQTCFCNYKEKHKDYIKSNHKQDHCTTFMMEKGLTHMLFNFNEKNTLIS